MFVAQSSASQTPRVEGTRAPKPSPFGVFAHRDRDPVRVLPVLVPVTMVAPASGVAGPEQVPQAGAPDPVQSAAVAAVAAVRAVRVSRAELRAA